MKRHLLILLSQCFFCGFSALAQDTRLSYDLPGNLEKVEASSGTAPELMTGPQNVVSAPGDLVSFTVLARGSRPLSYQWQFNSNVISGAVGDSLLLTNVAAAAFGAYRVVVSNPFGSVTSSNVLLHLDSDRDGLADSWEISHFGNLNETGHADYDQDGITHLAEFREGTLPKIFGSANPRLTIISDRGQVFATPNQLFYTNNQAVSLLAVPDPGEQFLGYLGAPIFGSFYNLTTNPATLRLAGSQTVRAIFGQPIPDSLDITNRWRIDQAGWYGQTNVTHDGVDAAQSARTFGKFEQAWLEVTNIMSGEGTVTFWWKVDGTPQDELSFVLNNLPRTGAIGTNTDWSFRTYYLPGGTNRLRWVYRKGGNEVSEYIKFVYAPADAGWVDEVKFEVWSDPLRDGDNDGMADLWELKHFDTLDIKPEGDPDLDGIANLDEFLEHTDPTSSISMLPRLAISASGGTVVRSPDLPKYIYAQKVGLTAVPDVDNFFLLWTGAATGTNITNVVSMTRNQSVNAIFGLPLARSLETPALVWTRGGPIGWFGQTNYTHDGVDAAQSGPVGPNELTWMETTVNGPGALSFWWQVSSRTNFDWAVLLVDGVEQPGKISGQVNWTPQVHYLPAGTHAIRWSYTNRSGFFSLTNGAWVDEVKFATGSFAPEILSQPASLTVLQGESATLRVVAAGGPLPTYQWFLNGASLGAAGTNSTLAISNAVSAHAGTYRVEVQNAVQTVSSAVATVIVLPVPPVNDNFSNRTLLSGVTEASGYDFGATLQPSEPNHDNQSPNYTVWWKWIAPAAGKYRLLVHSSGINVRAIAAIYKGTQVNNLTPIASDSQPASLTNGIWLADFNVPFDAEAGTEYAVALGHNFGAAGYFTLQILPGTGPANDDFAGAILLPGESATVSASNLNASREPGEPLHGGPGGASLWWKWISTRDGRAVVSAHGHGFLPSLAVYTGASITNLTVVALGVPSVTTNLQRARFTALAGTTYFIAVDSPPGTGGQFDLNAAMTEPSFLGQSVSPEGEFAFSVVSQTDSEYAIETSIDLKNWTPVITGIVPPGGVIAFSSPGVATQIMRYYRVVVTETP